jgi:hypothetical protein
MKWIYAIDYGKYIYSWMVLWFNFAYDREIETDNFVDYPAPMHLNSKIAPNIEIWAQTIVYF